MTNMAAIIAQMNILSEAIDQAVMERDRLRELVDSATGIDATNPTYKDDRGNLSEAGVAMMNQMLANGSPNAEIAKFFDISVSAVIYRRSRWEAAQARKAA